MLSTKLISQLHLRNNSKAVFFYNQLFFSAFRPDIWLKNTTFSHFCVRKWGKISNFSGPIFKNYSGQHSIVIWRNGFFVTTNAKPYALCWMLYKCLLSIMGIYMNTFFTLKIKNKIETLSDKIIKSRDEFWLKNKKFLGKLLKNLKKWGKLMRNRTLFPSFISEI